MDTEFHLVVKYVTSYINFTLSESRKKSVKCTVGIGRGEAHERRLAKVYAEEDDEDDDWDDDDVEDAEVIELETLRRSWNGYEHRDEEKKERKVEL